MAQPSVVKRLSAAPLANPNAATGREVTVMGRKGITRVYVLAVCVCFAIGRIDLNRQDTVFDALALLSSVQVPARRLDLRQRMVAIKTSVLKSTGVILRDSSGSKCMWKITLPAQAGRALRVVATRRESSIEDMPARLFGAPHLDLTRRMNQLPRAVVPCNKLEPVSGRPVCLEVSLCKPLCRPLHGLALASVCRFNVR